MRGQALSSSSGFPSDTNLLVDACIARVRETARLDEDAVLPPLPQVTPRRDVVLLRKERTAGSAAASGLASSRPGAPAGDELGRGAARGAVTQLVSRRSGRGRSRSAIFLCAMVASAFGTAAFVQSPLGRAPSVLRATTAAQAHASAAVGMATDAAAALFAR